MICQTLGHYRIEEELGAGGMGVVYRATDSKLGRQVAIKVLPAAFANHPERLARFEREARLLAALNHPNIAGIHGLEESGGVHYLILELVRGVTLAQRLKQGPLPAEEALCICRQIAEALDAAHEKGIVHRDLKPANVKITPEGKVKVLDFGLAKALAAPSLGVPDFSQSPTVTAEATEIGMVLGTAAYMSPEQARGKPVDKRTDIWAFGCVLFEALARRKVFHGDTMSDCMMAVLGSEPDWNALPAATPPNIRALLRRCLEKDVRRRLRDIGDAAIEIDDALAGRVGIAMPEAPVAWHKSRILAAAAAGFLAGGLAAALAVRSGRDNMPPRTVARFAIPLSEENALKPTNSPNVTISADGSRLAFAGVRASSPTGQIFIRAIDQDEARPSTDAKGGAPFFSPDGKWIGFFEGAGQTIRKVALSGGAPVTLATTNGIHGASWGEDGNIVWGFFNLFSVPAAGGPPKTLLKADSKNGERFYRQPWYLPGGKAILFTVGKENMQSYSDAQIAVLSLETGQKKILIEGGMCPRYSPTGHLVYARAGSLLAVPFDLKKLAISGQPFRVVDGVFMSARTGMAAFAISAKGDLVYAQGPIDTGDRQPFWVDRKGAATPLPLPPRPYLHPRLSPDDRQLAIEIEGAAHDSYSYDISRGTLAQFSFDGSTHWPLWSPQGDRITFRSGRTTPMSMWWIPADRSGEDERLGSIDGQMQNPESWSPDGRALLFTQKRKDAGSDILVLPLDGDRRPRPLVQTKFDEGAPKFSPDGKWVSYCSNESGRTEVYLTPYPGPGARIQVSTEGGTDAVWRRKGGELYYRQGDTMMVVSVTTQPKLTLSKPRALWQGKYTEGTSTMCGEPGATSTNYDVTADGERFLMIQEKADDAVARQVNVVLGWAEELKRLAKRGTE
jgi:Tol biopolymer transport system component